MVKFYADKIRTGTINPSTWEIWKVEDVPKVWRTKVEIELQK